jgi:oxygen-independent coproporphyrinogen-3 oxidase
MEASLYIHIPFCAGACDYCDFYSVPVKQDDPRLDRYIKRVLADVKQAFSEHTVTSVPTVYVGGGTPSILGSERLERALAGLTMLLPNTPLEFTVEANPESADEAFFKTCKKNGVSRISLGAQTFYEPSRKAVNRVGEARLLPERLELARSFYPKAFSIDLIAGLPLQDEAVLRADIEQALAFEPAHVSLYSLTIEENTPLWEKSRNSRKRLPDTDRVDQLWLAGRDLLERNGFLQYEISNFCLRGEKPFMSAHNLRYWRMENWLGIGAAASGTIIDDGTGTGLRRTVSADIGAYLTAPVFEEEVLDALTLIKETFLMGFRSVFGPDEALFQKRFHKTVEECMPETLASWRKRGLFENDRLNLTGEGLLFLDRFLRDAFSETERRHAPTPPGMADCSRPNDKNN